MRLKDYIQGNRRGKEANRLEREAMNDPFLQDALEGFDAVPDDHAPVIERLEKSILATAATPATLATPKNKRKVFFYGSIAASILLIIGFGVYFLSERNEPYNFSERNAYKETIVMHQSDAMEMESTIPSSSPPILSEEAEITTSTVGATKPMLEVQREQAVQEEILRITEDVSNSALAEQAAKQTVADNSANIMAAQTENVFSGKVVDEDGEPLIGVNIIIPGTDTGALTDVNGDFTIPFPENDSSKLIAQYVGYESKEIKVPDDKTVTLTPDTQALEEVVVIGYGTTRRASEANQRQRAAQAIENDNAPITFGTKEFQAYCQQKADKNVCDGKKVTVKVSFFIDETGKPTNINCTRYTCEHAKKEIETLLSSSPAWTTVNKKVTMTIKW